MQYEEWLTKRNRVRAIRAEMDEERRKAAAAMEVVTAHANRVVALHHEEGELVRSFYPEVREELRTTYNYEDEELRRVIQRWAERK